MVKIDEIKKKDEKKLCACRVPIKYIEALEKKNVSFTDFVLKAFEETFDN